MYKPQFKKSNDVYAIVDYNGTMSYVTLNAFLMIQRMPNVKRVDLAFRENSLIDDSNFEVIKRLGDSYTAAELGQAIDKHLDGLLDVDAQLELQKRLPNVMSVNLLFFL
jgi:hypothetical protein